MSLSLSEFAKKEMGICDAAFFERGDSCVCIYQSTEGLTLWILSREGDSITARMFTDAINADDVDIVRIAFEHIASWV